MNSTIDVVRAELERLFSLEEMTSISQRFLGLDPEDVGGAAAKGSFAKALTERCYDGDRIDALVDVILASRATVDPRIREFSRFSSGSGGGDEISAGDTFGHFLVLRKLGESELAIAYTARRDGEDCVLKVLRAEATRDKRAAYRFLTANRLVSEVQHPGLPNALDAGESEGRFWVSYASEDGEPLSAWFARTGASRYDDVQPILLGILEPSRRSTTRGSRTATSSSRTCSSASRAGAKDRTSRSSISAPIGCGSASR